MARPEIKRPELKEVDTNIWEVDQSYKEGMRVPARIVGSKPIIENMDLGVFDQISNVATLPGIQKYAMCMPDGHIITA